jgi:hypothetical protein
MTGAPTLLDTLHFRSFNVCICGMKIHYILPGSVGTYTFWQDIHFQWLNLLFALRHVGDSLSVQL